MPQHNDSCICQFNHKDYVTADGIRNLATYEIDSRCHLNGIKASKGTMWLIVWNSVTFSTVERSPVVNRVESGT